MTDMGVGIGGSDLGVDMVGNAVGGSALGLGEMGWVWAVAFRHSHGRSVGS